MRTLSLLSALIATTLGFGQMERIQQTIETSEAEAHLRFLTSDELKGRDTGTEELIIAGRYIAEQFRRYGLVPLGDAPDDFLQKVPLVNATAAKTATLEMIDERFRLNQELILVSGSNTHLVADLVFLEDLMDYKTQDVKGKVVVTLLGDYGIFNAPLSDLQKAGAVGLIQVYRPGWRYPWPLLVNYLSSDRMRIGGSAEGSEMIPHLWINDTAKAYAQQLEEASNLRVEIEIEGIEEEVVKAYNVVGKIEGTDPLLKKEHLIMTAHYDHIGTQQTQSEDSIYNGTRDNGIGTTGVINAAKYFGKYPPKRSIIFMALTGEEKGLLGSKYYADNPKIPLPETVFNLNIDNSGYTDTEHIFLLDTNRTTIDAFVYQAVGEVGLKVIGDRIPEQNYYERSDQVSFATKGVPAVNFRMSMTEFDERISRYYHQPADEFHTVDLNYIHKYWKAYIRTAELVGNWSQRPYWIEGDKFEAAGNALYEKE